MYIKINKKRFKIKYCNSFIDRLFGMMFKRKKNNLVYCFPNCNSIHTFFMFQNIDVIMTDKNNNILYTYKNLKPNKVIFPKKNVFYTYEISHGFIDNDIKNLIIAKED